MHEYENGGVTGFSSGELPPFLYHYQPTHSIEYKNRLEQILREQKLYCASPAQFNDPWDCKPYFPSDGFDELLATEHGRKILAARMKTPMAFAEHLQRDPVTRAKTAHTLHKQIHKNMDERWRVYCLTPCPAINLMWSHYAFGHTGVCLEFRTDNRIFSRVKKVHYSKLLPKLHLEDESYQIGMKLLLYKSDDWAYEQEVHLIARPREWSSDDLDILTTDGHLLPLPPDTISSIIVGCNSDLDFLTQIVKQYTPTLGLKKAVRSNETYRLSIEAVKS